MDTRKNRRERFLQDGREAWNEYIATGKSITARLPKPGSTAWKPAKTYRRRSRNDYIKK